MPGFFAAHLHYICHLHYFLAIFLHCCCFFNHSHTSTNQPTNQPTSIFSTIRQLSVAPTGWQHSSVCDCNSALGWSFAKRYAWCALMLHSDCLLFVDVTLRENCTIGNTLNTHALWRFPFLFETAAIDGLVSSWTENIFVSFCLRAPGYGLTLWCALGLLVGGAIQVASVTVTVTVTWHCVVFYKSCYISVVDSLMARVKQYMVDMAGKENNVIRTKFSEM